MAHAFRSTARNYRVPRDRMIQPAGDTSAQLLDFRGHITGLVNTGKIVFHPGYATRGGGGSPMCVICHGRDSGPDNAITATRTRLLAQMGVNVRNMVLLYPDAGQHSWYRSNADGSAPYGTTIRDEFFAYAKQRVNWNGQLVVLTFSMGCQWWQWVVEDYLTNGLKGMFFMAGPKLRHSGAGTAWTETGGPPTDAEVFRDLFGANEDAANPQNTPAWANTSAQGIATANAALLAAATASGRLRFRAGVGAVDGTRTGHHAFIDSHLTPNGIACTVDTDYPGIDHSFIGCLDGTGTNALGVAQFLESALAA